MPSVEINIVQNSIPRDHMENTKIDSELYECVKKDNIDEFKSRIQQRLTEKLVTPCGNSLLHVAVSYGSDNITSYLARTFPSLITIQNSQKDTILHLAAREGKASHAIRDLVNSNAFLLRTTNTERNTPLHVAVINGNKEVAKFLISRDPEVAYYKNKTCRSPLYLAVENCDGDMNGILDDLLNQEASIPTEREDGDSLRMLRQGKSPVHAAVKNRIIGILKKIEEAKPELLGLHDKDFGNPLHYASSTGYVEGVQFLLQKYRAGADETDQKGNYPIHLACKEGSVALLKEFLKVIPYANEFINKKKQNILHVAAQNGHGFLIMYILEQDQKIVKALLNAMDEDGNTPLHLATQHGQPTSVFLIVRDSRVYPRIVNDDGLTPYELGRKQSTIAVQRYEGTDETFAKKRQHTDSNNRVEGTEDKPADQNKQDTKKASLKGYGLSDFYRAMMTLSILHSYACPRKSFRDLFPGTRPTQPRKKETKTRIGNLLVVAVLVAGVTFAGAIQLPQLRGNFNSSEHHHEFHSSNITASHKISTTSYSPTDYEGLLYGYLSCNVWAFSFSLVASLSLLMANFSDPNYEIIAVGLSVFMVGSAILVMFAAFIYAVIIALLASHDAWLNNTITVEAFTGFYALVYIFIPWILPNLQGMLLHFFYYKYFLFHFYTYEWLPYKIYKRKHK
ncbi:PREDICTED: ankyrin repeat-containing protein At2g01680-like [Populus euphratica]|uniref:Ankyrin repeat-containing protein At2g01680-like n=1 Tax=Populus euphratica TaxID=75702 RepID=A0AAJ6UY85_POPEU|nr:PREDICTED: ankyrin repeat-containing protein At2g01680-like [Populus euphratica]